LLSISCSTPAVAKQLAEQHPNSQFEVRLTGCTATGELARSFGSDARKALLWSRERVKSGHYFPCTALIRVLSGSDTLEVYRVSFDRDGRYEEGPLPPK
jgi:hypothetical protein